MKARSMSLEDFLQHVTIQAIMVDFQWVYMPPPRIVFEPKTGPSFFLRPNSNKWEFLPRN